MKSVVRFVRPTTRSPRLAIIAILAILIYGFIIPWPGSGFLPRSSAPSEANGANLYDASKGTMIKSNREGNRTQHKASFLLSSADFGRVANRTLGFEKVIAIGLPERSDKRDALELMAALTGFDIDWVDGVKTSSMSDKAIPFGINLEEVHDNFLGSWRGHMNAIRRVVESGVSTALIIEDDMDWDVHLKLQLSDIANGSRQILGKSFSEPISPYGDVWDVLWLGHCGEPFPETLQENAGLDDGAKARMSIKHTISEDDTVPPYTQVSHLVDWSVFPPHTRLVHLSAAPICSFAYAVSQSAARKILFALSVDGLKMAFDNSLAQLCRDAIYDLGRQKEDGFRLKCLSVNPTIMFHHRAKGPLAGDSDIQSYGKDGSVRDKGMSESIKWSMRLNLRNILTGQPLRSQFEEEA